MSYQYEHPDERDFYLNANKINKEPARNSLHERWIALQSKWQKEEEENERADIVNMLKVELS